MRLLSTLASFLLLAGLTPVGAQEGATTIQARANLVFVPAIVTDRRNELVFGLTAEDFLLTDDGVPQPAHLEQDLSGQPIALVVLLEAGAATQASGWKPQQRDAPEDRFRTLPIMLEALAGAVEHRIAVVGFDSQPEVLQAFTSSFDKTAAAVAGFSSEDQGDHGAAILDSLSFAVDLLRTAPPGYRRVILLLSETRDRGSKLSLAQAVRNISDTNTVVYTFAYGTGLARVSAYGNKTLPTKRIAPPPRPDAITQQMGLANPAASGPGGGIAGAVLSAMTTGILLANTTPNPPGGCMGKDPDASSKPKEGGLSRGYDCLAQLAPPLALVRMAAIAAGEGIQRNTPETVARMTGGESFTLSDARSLERDLQTITNHWPNRYLLSFQPVAPRAGLHILELHVRDRDGLTATARRNYWIDR